MKPSLCACAVAIGTLVVVLIQGSDASLSGTTTELSIPNVAGKQERVARSAEVQALASQIKNEKRTWRIDGIEYPFYDGPKTSAGSLAEKIQRDEIAELATFEMTEPTSIYALSLQSRFSTIDDYTNFYANATKFMAKPISVDISDETFGYQRTTVKGFNMRKFRDDTDSYPVDAKLTDAAVAQICGGSGCSLAQIAKKNRLFVSDFSTFGTWSDPKKTGVKFVAPVVGFFCYNDDRKKLLPLAIRVVDTDLTYTPFDKQDEWTLAKMALETAEINFQQVQHLVDTHAVFVPVRVEVLRNLASSHPVSALLLRTNKIDLALEQRAAVFLLNESTILDNTFGFAAVGSTLFLDHQLQSLSVDKDEFDADIKRRGLDHLPIHKYAAYGRLYKEGIKDAISGFLAVYYASDQAVARDYELQNWARGCAAVTQLRGFPSAFTSRTALRKILTHLVLLTIRHHAMNGAATWESVAVPYSTPGLWKQLPTHKLAANETLNVLEYSIRPDVLPLLVTLAAKFNRRVPASESIVSLFQTPSFASEPKLAPVIASFEQALGFIDAFIVSAERNETWPYHILRPSMLSRYGWI